MNLEDHAGDVIRKARAMKNVSAAAVAQAAGLSAEELSQFEEAGEIGKRLNFAGVAGVLGLNATKLESVAKGWVPETLDLGTWRELRQITTGTGMTVHCYLVWDEVTREAALFDTGFEAEPIYALLDENQLQLKHIFITHSHADHVAALDAIRAKYPKSFLHSDMKAALPQHKNRRNDCVHLGSLRITNRETPGHAEDGVTYLVGNWPEDAPHVAIVGDAIFSGSMGKAGELGEFAKEKVREQILSLPADTLICPGHGPISTVAQEKANNPFF